MKNVELTKVLGLHLVSTPGQAETPYYTFGIGFKEFHVVARPDDLVGAYEIAASQVVAELGRLIGERM